MNLVVIPAYRRPAHLAATLFHVERNPRACYQRYLFSIDREAYKAIDTVIAEFKCPNSGVVRRRHKYPGHTFNVIEALRSACAMLKPTDLVYVIAEDVLVADDFFDFHEAAHALADRNVAFVSAVRGPRKILGRDVDTLIYRSPELKLQAVSFKAYWLECVLEHAVSAYHRNMIGYCAETFDHGPFPVGDCQIEGLIRRVLHERQMVGLHPIVPRACHVGFVGTNHGGRPAIDRLNPIDWKADAERIISMTDDQMNALADPEYRDIERCELIRSPVALCIV